jgi:hypothetical protein
MTTLRHHIAIRRPPDEVFAHLSDLGRMGEWQKGVSIERRGGPAGQVGERLRKVRATPIGRQGFELERTALDTAARSFTLTALDGVIKGSSEHWSVEAAADGTSVVRLDAPTRWNGLARLFAPVANGIADRQLASELPRLKAILEG